MTRALGSMRALSSVMRLLIRVRVRFWGIDCTGERVQMHLYTGIGVDFLFD